MEGVLIGFFLLASAAGIGGYSMYRSVRRERKLADDKLAAREVADTEIFIGKLSQKSKEKLVRPLFSPRAPNPTLRRAPSKAAKPLPSNPSPKKEDRSGSDFLVGAIVGAALSGGGYTPSPSQSDNSSPSPSYDSGGDFGGGGSSSDF